MVWGTIFNSNSEPSTLLMVKLVPSTVIEPLWAMYFANSRGARMRKRHDLASSCRETTSPIPSTWPDTMCPPKRSLACMAFSKLMRLPFFQLPIVVKFKLSTETSAIKPSAVSSTAVRQAPLQAMLSPSCTSARLRLPVRMVSRTSPPRCSRSAISPMALIIPVNIILNLLNLL